MSGRAVQWTASREVVVERKPLPLWKTLLYAVAFIVIVSGVVLGASLAWRELMGQHVSWILSSPSD